MQRRIKGCSTVTASGFYRWPYAVQRVGIRTHSSVKLEHTAWHKNQVERQHKTESRQFAIVTGKHSELRRKSCGDGRKMGIATSFSQVWWR